MYYCASSTDCTAAQDNPIDVRIPYAKTGDSNIISSVTGNVTGNPINVVIIIKSYDDEKPEDFNDLHKKAGFVLSVQHPDTLCRG